MSDADRVSVSPKMIKTERLSQLLSSLAEELGIDGQDVIERFDWMKGYIAENLVCSSWNLRVSMTRPAHGEGDVELSFKMLPVFDVKGNLEEAKKEESNE